jgi:light-harvesting protein B-800-850 alpha chain
MNQYRIWLVVKPSVGLPIFLVAAMMVSLLTHMALLTHTTWVTAFFNGGAKAHTVAAAPAAAPASTASTQ